MKHLFFVFVCACMALAAVAGVPKQDAARLRQALKNGPVIDATKMGEGKSGQVSFHQFMREHNVNPGDNRITKNAPRRQSADSLNGGRIISAEVWPLKSDNGELIVGDTAFSMGWNASISYAVDSYFIDGFYGDCSMPIYMDGDIPYIYTCTIKDELIEGQITGTSLLTRTDTLTWAMCIVDDNYWEDEDVELQPGTIYDDGSILFPNHYYVYYEKIVNKYRIRRSDGAIVGLLSTDTTAVVSPVYNNIYLLNSNGIHECDYMALHHHVYSRDSLDFSRLDLVSLLVQGDDSGSGGSGSSYVLTDIFDVDGTSGLHPRPIGPRRGLTRVGGDPWDAASTFYLQNGSIQAPVYMFQLDESTICVYNLYGVGYTASIMTLHPNGSVTMPSQVMLYSGADFYNCSPQEGYLQFGNTGALVNDSIEWGLIIPCSLTSEYTYNFDNNRLYLTDGSHFELPLLLRDVNRDRMLTVADVSSLINHVLNSDLALSPNFDPTAADVNNDGEVTIADITLLIHVLLSGEQQ